MKSFKYLLCGLLFALCTMSAFASPFGSGGAVYQTSRYDQICIHENLFSANAVLTVANEPTVHANPAAVSSSTVAAFASTRFSLNFASSWGSVRSENVRPSSSAQREHLSTTFFGTSSGVG